MNQDEAIRLATDEVKRRGSSIADEPPTAFFKQRHMRLGKNLSGWLVVFRLNADGFDPSHLHVEVYEPDGEINVPALL